MKGVVKFLFCLCILWLNENKSFAQEKMLRLDLQKTIELAKGQSPDAKAAENRFENTYWKYRMYRSEKLTVISLNGTLPDLNRTISDITLPDGRDAFIPRSLANSSLSLSINQNIGFTGGEVFVNSSLKRIDIFEPNASITYLSNPLLIGFRQPLFSFNEFRWERKIEPLKYREAKKEYLAELEEVSIQAVNRYFDLYLARININIARKNKANYDTLYKIAKGRYNLGKIAENELLQMELSLLNAGLEVERSNTELDNALFRLRSFIGLDEKTKIKLQPPREAEKFRVAYSEALDQAKQNRADVLGFERQVLEARRDVVKAKKSNDFDANVFATYGLTKRAEKVESALENPRDQEQLRVGLEIPILDWGRGKAREKMAKANQELVRTQVKQEKIDFEQEVFLITQEFNIKVRQLTIARKADTISIKRYEVAKQRFLLGKVDITDLNLASTEQDRARRGYVQALRNYWLSYFRLRKLTLYDFENQRPLEFNVEKVVD